MISVTAFAFLETENPKLSIRNMTNFHYLKIGENLSLYLNDDQLKDLTQTLVNYLASIENPKPDFELNLERKSTFDEFLKSAAEDCINGGSQPADNDIPF